jgi:carboxypeptidase T
MRYFWLYLSFLLALIAYWHGLDGPPKLSHSTMGGQQGTNEEIINERHLQGISAEFSCYRTISETYDRMEELENGYPGMVSVKTIGQSFWTQQNDPRGHDIKVLIINTTGNNTTPFQKTDMMLVGGQHSRELPPPEVLLRWAEHLLANYPSDPDIAWILYRTNVHIIPISNPDGRQIEQDDLGAFHRKNARPNSCPEGPARYGVDLNRNYPLFYGDDEGSSSDPCDNMYRGTGPLSEPEAVAVFEYHSEIFPNYIKKGTPQEAFEKRMEPCAEINATGIFMDLHSHGDNVYFPWGYKDVLSPDHLPLLTMAAKLAAPGNYTLWGPDQEKFRYPTPGDATDSAYGINCIFSQGYEIGTKKHASCEELETKIMPVLKESLLYAAKCVSAPYILPLGPDVLRTYVNSTNPKDVILIVEVSDEALIVDHATYRQKSWRSQPIAQVKAYVDHHPYDSASDEGFLMEPVDGAYDDIDEIVTLRLDMSHLTGRHILYFQATDADGNPGPASAVYVDLITKNANSTHGKGSAGNSGLEDSSSNWM